MVLLPFFFHDYVFNKWGNHARYYMFNFFSIHFISQEVKTLPKFTTYPFFLWHPFCWKSTAFLAKTSLDKLWLSHANPHIHSPIFPFPLPTMTQHTHTHTHTDAHTQTHTHTHTHTPQTHLIFNAWWLSPFLTTTHLFLTIRPFPFYWILPWYSCQTSNLLINSMKFVSLCPRGTSPLSDLWIYRL